MDQSVTKLTGVNDPKLIDLTNQLQDVASTLGTKNLGIDIPQIVVVGSQSSGKSSVLEAIVGRDFLPRGSGMVTRRPLVLQLYNIPLDESVPEKEREWGQFQHLEKKFYNFNEIRTEIQRATDSKVAKNKVSPEPINLRIYSPHVLTLTLVDLPGITRTAVVGQDHSIVGEIIAMSERYIASSVNTIILAVSASNTDIANSDGIALARKHDPEGERTIGVLTKIDLMDKGTDVLPILSGKDIPLRLGYVPVVNRGQRDIENNKSIRDALVSEREFFMNHRSYQDKADFCGTTFLAARLSMILTMKIKVCLPGLRNKVGLRIQSCRKELDKLGDEYDNDTSSTKTIQLIGEFCREYDALLDGKSDNISTTELSGGARLSYVFHTSYADTISSINPLHGINNVDIKTALCNSSGTSYALFINNTTFENIVKTKIRLLRDPSLECLNLILKELFTVLDTALTKPTFVRYPHLKKKLREAVINCFNDAMLTTSALVRDIIEMETNYVNTAHPDLISGSRALAMVREKYDAPPPKAAPQVDPRTGKPLPPQAVPAEPTQSAQQSTNSFFGNLMSSTKLKKNTPTTMEAPPPKLQPKTVDSDQEKHDIEALKILVNSYFNIVRRNVLDVIPKAIMLKLVQYTRQNLQNVLLAKIYAVENLDELLQESDQTRQRRKTLHEQLKALYQVQNILEKSEQFGL